MKWYSNNAGSNFQLLDEYDSDQKPKQRLRKKKKRKQCSCAKTEFYKDSKPSHQRLISHNQQSFRQGEIRPTTNWLWVSAGAASCIDKFCFSLTLNLRTDLLLIKRYLIYGGIQQCLFSLFNMALVTFYSEGWFGHSSLSEVWEVGLSLGHAGDAFLFFVLKGWW